MKTSIEQLQENGLESYGIFVSVYPAIVADNNDPEGLARLKVKMPTFGGITLDSWAMPFGVPLADKSGLLIIPQIGDNVWVQFLQSNLQYPIWTYGAMAQAKKIVSSNLQHHYQTNKEGTYIALREKLELNGKDEKAVLGDTLKQILNELISACKSLQVICASPGNPSAGVVNIAQFDAIANKLDTILSKKVLLGK